MAFDFEIVPDSRPDRRIIWSKSSTFRVTTELARRHSVDAAVTAAREANTEIAMSRSSESRFRFRPALECLGDRVVPTVTYHGGVLLPHVEVQGMYLGSDWATNSTYYNQTALFENFNRFLPQSSYMDLLTQLGYGVGRGSMSSGTIDRIALNKNYFLTDSTIRSEIQRFINAGYLQQPDANRLYVVYVEPGVAIMNDHDHNSTSTRNFAGYHGAFAGRTAGGYAADIHYAVIAYAGGYNAIFPGLSPYGSMTLTASHEIAEAATDPNVNYRALSWYDDYRGEIGDFNRYEALLNGYAVQSIVNKNGVAYIPYGGTTLRALDATGAGAFASHFGYSAVADVRFRLASDRTDDSGVPTGRAPNSGFQFVSHTRSHSARNTEAPGFAEDFTWFTSIVGAYSDV
jgi:hypothetical protein